MERNKYTLYGNIVKVDGNRKTFQPYGENKVMSIKNRDNFKVGDAVSLTMYESRNFNLLQVSLVKYTKVPVFIKRAEKISGGIHAILKTKDEKVIINRQIMYNDPLFEELKTKGQLTAAIFAENVVFLEKAMAV